VREVREELGVEIEVVEGPVLLKPHTYGPDGAYVLAIGFRVRIVSGEPNPTDDVAQIRWISTEDIDDTDFAWEHDRGFVRAALEDAYQYWPPWLTRCASLECPFRHERTLQEGAGEGRDSGT
jgi:ADP-ribose pyrophosphatase YjhB (NUDIX family)